MERTIHSDAFFKGTDDEGNNIIEFDGADHAFTPLPGDFELGWIGREIRQNAANERRLGEKRNYNPAAKRRARWG